VSVLVEHKGKAKLFLVFSVLSYCMILFLSKQYETDQLATHLAVFIFFISIIFILSVAYLFGLNKKPNSEENLVQSLKSAKVFKSVYGSLAAALGAFILFFLMISFVLGLSFAGKFIGDYFFTPYLLYALIFFPYVHRNMV